MLNRVTENIGPPPVATSVMPANPQQGHLHLGVCDNWEERIRFLPMSSTPSPAHCVPAPLVPGVSRYVSAASDTRRYALVLGRLAHGVHAVYHGASPSRDA